MADFTGMTVKVTLKAPSGMVLQGRVKHIVPGQLLTLQNVYFLHNGQQCPEYSIRGPTIADLQVVNSTNPLPLSNPLLPTPAAAAPPQLPTPPAPLPFTQQMTQHASAQLPSATPARRTPSDFVDPAILSYGRSPAPSQPAARPPPPSEQPATPIKAVFAKAAETLPRNPSSPFIGLAGKSGEDGGRQGRQMGGKQPVNNEGDAGPEEEQVDGTAAKKKGRRGLKKKQPAGSIQDPPPVMDAEVSRNGNDMNGTVKRGKGWRQTPLLQPSPQPSLNARQNRRRKEEQQNGWATEDATDIQDHGDFDFEASNNLFDKAQVFSELRQGDTTADEDRLVSHNRIHRPGTYGGKNLHPTENVLSPVLAAMDSSSDADTELNLGPNGRSSSRHSVSRAAMRKGPSRQNSAQVDGGGRTAHPLSASVSSDRGGLPRSGTSVSGKAAKVVPSAAASPLPIRAKSPISTASAAARTQASAVAEPHFIIKSTQAPCPVLHPSALETLEAETTARYGLTPEAMTETAARGIAETALSMFAESGARRPSRTNTSTTTTLTSTTPLEPQHTPVIVIIAGNHSTSARALAAARHLATRQTHLIIIENPTTSSLAPEAQHPETKSQLTTLKRMIKSGAANIKRGPWTRASTLIKNLPAPPDLIIDALLSGSPFPASSEQEATTQREIIDWANRSRAPVLSLTCPSGVSGIDGSAPVVEGEPLAIRPERVLAFGAPVRGLLDAVVGGERWGLGLVDLGVNVALRREEAVQFGRGWGVEVEVVGGV
ncbi:YjeF-related protein N-terminus-domain-containing protein [Neohortaea acidophila]|uniref:Enhancer of mRNA-decapping protein 3 n=1 Tax=Neohortaea acidophila TaxID=245834 RepID=A0A6A6Q1Z1_9PEZI|nr:YjeF-related protein N-terminus-domain-containing protein [Neohortaea acidophila]KAF2486295.1 YjeF-related protein N-terminus-domain-containing protein [Neohortaea acidophila]